jgi:branched-chain amino acid transport system substrate-binding protein
MADHQRKTQIMAIPTLITLQGYSYMLKPLIISSLLVCSGTVLADMPKAEPPAKAEQFFPIMTYRSYTAGATMFGAFTDYLAMLNARDGGINGVRLAWEDCDSEYKTDKGIECYEKLKKQGKASAFALLQTSLAYALIERSTEDKIPIVTLGSGRSDAIEGNVFPYIFPLVATYWRQNTAKIQFIAEREGGIDKLKGKKIVHLYHNSAYGKETINVLDAQAEKFGFNVEHFSINPPGTEQQGIWLHIRRTKADWVILRGFGAMNSVALKEAKRAGFPIDHMIGSAWSSSEEDTQPVGDAAKGFIAASFNAGGDDFRVITDIKQRIYAENKGHVNEKHIGSIYYNRGIVLGILSSEAIRIAQEKFGKQPLTGEQVRWGYEHLNLTDARLKELGAEGLITSIKTNCHDHEGGGKMQFHQWDGEKWQVISQWITPDESLIKPMVQASVAQYAKEHQITHKECEATP